MKNINDFDVFLQVLSIYLSYMFAMLIKNSFNCLEYLVISGEKLYKEYQTFNKFSIMLNYRIFYSYQSWKYTNISY